MVGLRSCLGVAAVAPCRGREDSCLLLACRVPCVSLACPLRVCPRIAWSAVLSGCCACAPVSGFTYCTRLDLETRGFSAMSPMAPIYYRLPITHCLLPIACVSKAHRYFPCCCFLIRLLACCVSCVSTIRRRDRRRRQPPLLSSPTAASFLQPLPPRDRGRRQLPCPSLPTPRAQPIARTQLQGGKDCRERDVWGRRGRQPVTGSLRRRRHAKRAAKLAALVMGRF